MGLISIPAGVSHELLDTIHRVLLRLDIARAQADEETGKPTASHLG